MDPDNNDNDMPEDLDHEELTSAERKLWTQLRRIGRAAGITLNMELPKARTLLEATAGDAFLAAQLYWDDYVARRYQQEQEELAAAADADTTNRNRQVDHNNAVEQQQQEGQQQQGQVAEHDPDPQFIRDLFQDYDDAAFQGICRRLDSVFFQHHEHESSPLYGRADPDDDNEDDEGDYMNDNAEFNETKAVEDKNVARMVASARDWALRLHANDDNFPRNLNVAEMMESAQETARAHLLNARQMNNGASMLALHAARALASNDDANNQNDRSLERASVSDDEINNTKNDGAVWKRSQRACESNSHDDVERPRKRRKKSEANSDEETDLDENGYLSDNDWLWESFSPRDHIPLGTPYDVLWGISVSESASLGASSTVALDGRALIADDDADEDRKESAGIPCTWLHAGFSLSECATGLALKAPSDDDIAFDEWQEKSSGDDSPRAAPPLPYHCRALSCLHSVVTALLYTGAAVEGNTIIYASRKPFAELTKEERKQQFDARLADALTTLLFVAAKASKGRKLLALHEIRTSKDPSSQRKWQRLERKLNLCPTCRWEQDQLTGEIRIPDGREVGKEILISTSYTHVEDLRASVISNLRSFTRSGGCALFLESIFRIHGKSAIVKMTRLARKKAGLPEMKTSLINCTCEQRHLKKVEENPQWGRNLGGRANRLALDTTPLGHDCMSTEFLSLLLTGRVHSTFKGWSTGPLGIGILSDRTGEVCLGLTRPERSVWVLRGPTCYSVLWVRGSQDCKVNDFARLESPNLVADMTHWNCWYGVQNKTDLRLVTRQFSWNPPDTKESLQQAMRYPLSITEHIQEELTMHIMSADYLTRTEAIDPDLIVTQEEIDRVKVNAEDQAFYPNKYRLWKYGMDQGEPNTPFYRLSDREKLIVETKLGPKINTIMRTRWSRAIVDRFVPEPSDPIV